MFHFRQVENTFGIILVKIAAEITHNRYLRCLALILHNHALILACVRKNRLPESVAQGASSVQPGLRSQDAHLASGKEISLKWSTSAVGGTFSWQYCDQSFLSQHKSKQGTVRVKCQRLVVGNKRLSC